jgi:hypothetical protein
MILRRSQSLSVRRRSWRGKAAIYVGRGSPPSRSGQARCGLFPPIWHHRQRRCALHLFHVSNRRARGKRVFRTLPSTRLMPRLHERTGSRTPGRGGRRMIMRVTTTPQTRCRRTIRHRGRIGRASRRWRALYRAGICKNDAGRPQLILDRPLPTLVRKAVRVVERPICES